MSSIEKREIPCRRAHSRGNRRPGCDARLENSYERNVGFRNVGAGLWAAVVISGQSSRRPEAGSHTKYSPLCEGRKRQITRRSSSWPQEMRPSKVRVSTAKAQRPRFLQDHTATLMPESFEPAERF